MNVERPDILIYVGREFYGTREEFVYEASEKLSPTGELGFGCCRRVPKIPQALELGLTEVHLLHREGPGEPAMLFGSYVADGIIRCSQIKDVQDQVRRGIPMTAVGAAGRAVLPERGCGGIDPPALYLVSPRDLTVQLGLRPDTGRTGKLTLIEPPLNLGDLKHFRGFRQILWEELMGLVV